jgi:hypothetical protein
MVIDNSASLALYSETHSAVAVTEALGLVPETSGEIGDAKHPVRIGADGQPVRQFFYKEATWIYKVPEEVDPNDQSGFSSVRRLVDLFREKSKVLAELRENYRTVIWWAGFSNSSQGGFVIDADLLVSLGELGCDLFGTVYIDDDEDESDAGPEERAKKLAT